jgi:hypothetical protein
MATRAFRGIAAAATAAVLVAAAIVLLPAPGGRADEASSVERQYQARVEIAVGDALRYLARQQQKNGSFSSGMRDNTGIASLCVMAFLAKGYTPATGPYGPVIDRGIDFVLNSQQRNGLLVSRSSHGPMYSHSISTLMLSEVSGMVDARRQKRIDKALPEALKVILSAQKIPKQSSHEGGWRYQHTSRDSDISCTGWAVMALRSARGNGARVPSEAIDKAVGYVLRCRHRSGGFCYMPRKEPGLARTGTALLCLELCGRHRDKATVGAGDWILKHLHRRYGGNDGFFYYGLYYCSQGMFQLGGNYWETWARHMYEMMLKHQRKDGSWPQGHGNESKAGTSYSTAMAVLALAVSYRQLPIYQR